MTVRELIEELKQFDPDMIVATNYDIFHDVDVSIKTWIDSNYPYNEPDVNYVSLE